MQPENKPQTVPSSELVAVPHTASIRRRLAVAIPVAIIIVIAGLFIKAAGNFEMPLSIALNKYHHGVVGALGNFMYHAIGPVAAIAGTAAVTLIIFVASRRWTTAATFAVTIAGSWLSVALVKLFVHRSRPDAALLSLPYHPIQIDASYPSGHMAFATAVVVTIVLMMQQGVRRRVVAAIGAVLVVLVGLLLTIDAVHYPTDVLASVIWVLAVAPLVYAIWTVAILPRLTRK